MHAHMQCCGSNEPMRLPTIVRLRTRVACAPLVTKAPGLRPVDDGTGLKVGPEAFLVLHIPGL